MAISKSMIDRSAIDTLKTKLSPSSEIVLPESEKYADSLKRWSTAAEKPAGLVVYPTTAEDVSKAVLFAKDNGIDLAVVCGGHSTSGASSTGGGACIDLSKMRKVTVDPEAKTVTAQGGALWKDVDVEAEKYQLAAVGGTVNHTGIGGLTLGGGYGYLSPAHGLVIDNLVSVEMVLADGSIVTVSDSENPDLFWAVKGAGIGFGVATEFVYRAHEQKNPVWGGIVAFPKAQLPAVIDVGNKIMQDSSSDKAMMMMGFAAMPPAHVPMVAASIWYNGPEEEAKAYYKPLLDLGPLVDHTKPMAYSGSNEMLNPVANPGFRKTLKGSAFMAPLDMKLANFVWDEYIAFLEKIPDACWSVVFFEFIPFRQILKVPQTATAFANRGAYGNLLFAPGWTDPANDMACREWTRMVSAKTRKELERRKEEGTDEVTKQAVGEYMNYAGLGEGGSVVFGVNFPRLVELKKRYDPYNVFSKGPSLHG